MNYANYVHLDIKVNPETLTTLEEKFRYDQNVFRHLTVNMKMTEDKNNYRLQRP